MPSARCHTRRLESERLEAALLTMMIREKGGAVAPADPHEIHDADAAVAPDANSRCQSTDGNGNDPAAHLADSRHMAIDSV